MGNYRDAYNKRMAIRNKAYKRIIAEIGSQPYRKRVLMGAMSALEISEREGHKMSRKDLAELLDEINMDISLKVSTEHIVRTAFYAVYNE